jgi:hypothetical protein
MTRIMRSWLLLPIVFAALALASPAPAQTMASTEKPAAKKKAAPQRSPQANGHVYLLRGLLNIFSLGMDDLAAKIQGKGIGATVYNHSEWQGIADEIAAKYKARQHGPVVLVGHSLGADAVMYMAEYLGKKGVPVALVVPFDGTGSFAASANVGQVYNLTQRDYAHMRRGAGFRGQLHNVDVSAQGYGHIDIDKSARLHAMVLARIQAVIRTRGGPTTADGGAPAPRPRPAPQPQQASPDSAAPAATAAVAPAPAPAPATATSAASAPAPAAASAPASGAGAAPAASAQPKPAPATTASANAGANVASEQPAAAPPTVSRPATVPAAESNARRAPAGSPDAKPTLRF